MSLPEFEKWVQYYKDYPFSDFYRYHRPAALIAASHGSGKVEEFLDFLQPDPKLKGMSDSDLSVLKAFGMKKRG